jgi:D-alanyl-D-alanine carboxypeptidase
MGRVSTEARNGLRSCVLGLTAIVAVLTIGSNAADARHHRMRVHIAHHTGRIHHYARGEGYSPPSASIIVDGNSGEALEASDADALRHPASLTKIMTLYLLFERLQAGKIQLDSLLAVSEHAAEQAPTKLGLKPGQTINVEDAIKGVVTRSANDAAVVIAENLGGSEDGFAKLMTQKAHELGMSHTTYVNASGLPDDDQLTSARDQALLGRAIQDRFPRYYRFFSTTSFVFHGETIRGHNHLLGSVAGVDGIKTGFTRASGFNLVTSLHRDGRYIVGVVLGGRSAFERDAHMRQLLEADFRLASAHRTAPVVAERGDEGRDLQPAAAAKQPARPRADPTRTATATPRLPVGSTDPIRPILVRTVSYRTVTVRTGSLAPMPVLVRAEPTPQPSAVAQLPADAQLQAPPVEAPRTVEASAEPMPVVIAAPPPSEPAPVTAATPEPVKPVATVPPMPQSHAHGGWIIQIGAFGGEDEARQHLSEAQSKLHETLGTADPFTERVQKGDTTLYRARFAGLDKATAEAACRQLKRNDFACMAIKD